MHSTMTAVTLDTHFLDSLSTQYDGEIRSVLYLHVAATSTITNTCGRRINSMKKIYAHRQWGVRREGAQAI